MVFLINLLNKAKKVLIPCEILNPAKQQGSYFYLFSHSKFWDVTDYHP
jgi:hypothetical protein